MPHPAAAAAVTSPVSSHEFNDTSESHINMWHIVLFIALGFQVAAATWALIKAHTDGKKEERRNQKLLRNWRGFT
jgi:hypothetical protein